MIYGIGTDIVETKRFKKWVLSGSMINRFFNADEILSDSNKSLESLCEYYSARFAAKEAFSKALGTGILGFELKDVCVLKTEEGRPYLRLSGKALELFNSRCTAGSRIQLSISHEKEYAVAFVIIESS